MVTPEADAREVAGKDRDLAIEPVQETRVGGWTRVLVDENDDLLARVLVQRAAEEHMVKPNFSIAAWCAYGP